MRLGFIRLANLSSGLEELDARRVPAGTRRA
jgi:hypothetical protein